MNLIEFWTKWFLRHPPGKIATVRNDNSKIGRNQPCPCGSKRKYKYCCLSNENEPLTQFAKEELEKERKWLLKSAHRRYKEKTNEKVE